jgi:hypothetical protein
LIIRAAMVTPVAVGGLGVVDAAYLRDDGAD